MNNRHTVRFGLFSGNAARKWHAQAVPVKPGDENYSIVTVSNIRSAGIMHMTHGRDLCAGAGPEVPADTAFAIRNNVLHVGFSIFDAEPPQSELKVRLPLFRLKGRVRSADALDRLSLRRSGRAYDENAAKRDVWIIRDCLWYIEMKKAHPVPGIEPPVAADIAQISENIWKLWLPAVDGGCGNSLYSCWHPSWIVADRGRFGKYNFRIDTAWL